MIFFPEDSRMIRGPRRRAIGVYGEGSFILGDSFDLVTGICYVGAQTVNQSGFNAIASGDFRWQSYDRICTALNYTAVSGGGLVSRGVFGTAVLPVLNTSPLCCTIYLVDTPVVPATS